MTSDSLSVLRREIDEADARLLEALAARRRAVLAIAGLKRRSGMAIVQPARFAALLDERLSTAARLGLSLGYVRALFELVHEQSILDQRALPGGEETASR
jgi:chorismate mutase